MNESCPFCGKSPEIIHDPLWHGSHCYHDCYDIYIKCCNPECPIKPKTRAYNTIYEKSIITLQQKAWDDWNTRPKQEATP